MIQRTLVVFLTLLVGTSCFTRRTSVSSGLAKLEHNETGIASWYGIEEEGRATASGEIMVPKLLTAAHQTLPFGSLVRVTEIDTGNSVEVIINDRGPFVRNRIIDLSYAAAQRIKLVGRGITKVYIEVIGSKGPLANRRWRIQIGSFIDQVSAIKLAAIIESKGFKPVSISILKQANKRYYRVLVGSFHDRASAERLNRQLQKSGQKGFVLLTAANS